MFESKSLYSILLLLCLLILSVSSCKDNLFSPENSFMVARVDDVPWKAEVFGASRANGLTVISGTSNTGQKVTLTLTGGGRGVYTMGDGTVNLGSYLIEGDSVNYATLGNVLAGGSAVVSDLDLVDKYISGSFTFNAFGDVNSERRRISNGEFRRVPLTVDFGPSGNNVLQVNINGGLWEAEIISAFETFGDLYISASSTLDDQVVNLSFPALITEGTYPLSYLGTQFGQYNIGTSIVLLSESGSLEILEHNFATRLVRGNFSFVATDPLGTMSSNLTEGEFSVNY